MSKSLEECEAVLRADLELDKAQLNYAEREFLERGKRLLEREQNLAANARSMYEAGKVDEQHNTDARLAERLARVKFGDRAYLEPTPDEVRVALSHFNATAAAFGMALGCMERPQAESALIVLYRQDTLTAEQAAAKAAREAAIAQLVSAAPGTLQRRAETEYARMKAQEEVLEA